MEDQDENENVEQQNESGIDTVDEGGPEEPQTPPKFNDISLDAITSSPEADPSANESFSSFNPKYADKINKIVIKAFIYLHNYLYFNILAFFEP